MPNSACNVSIPKTTKELDQAVQYYKSADLSGPELFCQWEAIRMASLMQTGPDMPNDQVSDEESY